jgi:hypothetical protein
VRCDYDEDGSLLIRARPPAEEGALVLAALAAGRDAPRDHDAATKTVARGLLSTLLR